MELAPLAVAGFIHGKLDGRRTAVQNQYWERRHGESLSVEAERFGRTASQRVSKSGALRAC
jgi:hypothetical protein